jgi:hypothetical protein
MATAKTNDPVTIKISGATAALLNGALMSLEGRQTIVETNDGRRQRGPVQPYSFKNGLVYLAIRKNMTALAPILDEQERATADLLRSLVPPGEEGLDPRRHTEAFRAYIDGVERISSAEQNVSLRRILYSDLDVGSEKDGKNPIAQTGLSLLERHGILVEED